MIHGVRGFWLWAGCFRQPGWWCDRQHVQVKACELWVLNQGCRELQRCCVGKHCSDTSDSTYIWSHFHSLHIQGPVIKFVQPPHLDPQWPCDSRFQNKSREGSHNHAWVGSPETSCGRTCSQAFGGVWAWVWILASLLISCVTRDTILNPVLSSVLFFKVAIEKVTRLC